MKKGLRSLTLAAAGPYLWGFAFATALDRVVDVQDLLFPVVCATIAIAGCVAMRRSAR
jgi:hypothetical protein